MRRPVVYWILKIPFNRPANFPSIHIDLSHFYWPVHSNIEELRYSNRKRFIKGSSKPRISDQSHRSNITSIVILWWSLVSLQLTNFLLQGLAGTKDGTMTSPLCTVPFFQRNVWADGKKKIEDTHRPHRGHCMAKACWRINSLIFNWLMSPAIMILAFG